MEPCGLCVDSFTESLFRLECGCEFHAFCFSQFAVWRNIPTCPKCGKYVTKVDQNLLQDQPFLKRKNMYKHRLVAEPALPKCILCRRVFDGKRIRYRLTTCDHLFHASCLKMYAQPKCLVDGILLSPTDLEYLHIKLLE